MAQDPDENMLDISFVIPLMNEEGSLEELYRQISDVMRTMERSFEVIFVDDGSVDGSMEVLRRLHKLDDRVSVISFRRNFGKAAALSAGFKQAAGAIVFTMDADLQDDPKEIPRFVEMLEKGYDLVTGWKQCRHDPVSKTLPSKIFNVVTSFFSGVKLHDFNCGFKAYRAEVLEHIDIYGELHRYIPALAAWKGFRVSELVVEHRARPHGKSKYGWERFARGFFDLMTVILLTKYAKRPLHLFGMVGLFFSLLGGFFLVYLAVIWTFNLGAIGNRPLLLYSMMLFITGVQLISIGLVSEILVRQDQRRSEKYVIRCMMTSKNKNQEPKQEERKKLQHVQ